jgi:capsular polysaccharide export protein
MNPLSRVAFSTETVPLRLASFSRKLSQLPALAQLLGQPVAWAGRPWLGFAQRRFNALVGWGLRPSTVRARAVAQQHGLPFVALEDGFLRSYGTGERFPPLSVVVDELGIYYDSTRPSALEALLAGDGDVLAGMAGDVARARGLVLRYGLSKYNHAGEGAGDGLLPATQARGRNDGEGAAEVARKVLVVDQTFGDMSVALGGATAATFDAMLAEALADNPQATVYVKTHPEVSSGRKGGYLTQVQPGPRTVLLRDAVNPLGLIQQMDRVYVVTSTMGFEALLASKPVTCFGVPWYAGWGVTDDRCAHSPAWSRRTRKRTVEELFAAAYIHYTRYLNPVTLQRGSILDAIDWLIRQKDMATRMHSPDRMARVVGVGFRRWKAANLKPMLGLHPQRVSFTADLSGTLDQRLQPGDTVVCWGGQPPTALAEHVRSCWARLLHVEDGFLRSVGLGSDLIRPQSIVLDERGIYFDATRPSDLEHLLLTRAFTAEDLARAQAVRTFVVEHGISKYNHEPRQPVCWREAAQGRAVVLVPGQVEDDASIKLGCTTVRTNLGLLQAVRAARPDAYIVYKPHPDVLSGNRQGRVALQAARQWADHIEAGTSVVSCIEACDEVHTMTSLTGFDALLRGRHVVTYGQPFYAGWGLTEDRAERATAFERRTRRLSLDELVAGALLHYPIYWDWSLKGYTTCEAVLHRILEERTALEANGGLDQLRVGWWRRQWRKAVVLLKSLHS